MTDNLIWSFSSRQNRYELHQFERIISLITIMILSTSVANLLFAAVVVLLRSCETHEKWAENPPAGTEKNDEVGLIPLCANRQNCTCMSLLQEHLQQNQI